MFLSFEIYLCGEFIKIYQSIYFFSKTKDILIDYVRFLGIFNSLFLQEHKIITTSDIVLCIVPELKKLNKNKLAFEVSQF